MPDVIFSLDGDNYDPLPAAYVVRDGSDDQQDPIFVENGFMDFFSLLFGQQQQQQQQEDNPILDHKQIARDDDWTMQPQRKLFTKQYVNHENQYSFALASLDLLNINYGKGFSRSMTRSSEYNIYNDLMMMNTVVGAGAGAGTGIGTDAGGHKLPVEEILRVGGERFIQFSSNRVDGISTFIHPYYNNGSSLSGLSVDDARDVELVHLLLDAADKLGTRHRFLDLATKIILLCLGIASDSGSPIQRVSYYFAQALQHKIDTESNINSNNYKKKKLHQQEQQEQQEQQHTEGKIHLIDLQIRSGIQWTALMQGLVDYYPIQCLKITAVGTSDQRHCIEETGKRLITFSKSLNLPFSFEILYLKDMSEFKEDLLNIEADETVVVYSYMMLRTMISRPDLFENLMRAITRLRPALMLVIEVEANHNSPLFIDRFIEALVFYTAFFDCLESCMERSNEYRRELESTYFGEGITNIVAAEGEERVTRNVKLDVWRAFFTRFGMVETELSESAKYQASLVLNKFAHGSSCTLECDGKGLIVGWKGTPFHSLTAWNFSSYNS
ncbi:PREDICTED: DELLA protein RGL1-like [Erythranthe guttata]|uniref:DELLA protein RGL1-like n=1 Tax=Erythranthe guttata TaxID=4155 RepID=UPI00064D8649|nr:PREDICTED: DELLA protein RGL1-like [Erythranthe guttata]|eukprot:XP_012835789.1 PREDICTED: DELLA protein RGL1-like [Erythranthe guttata]